MKPFLSRRNRSELSGRRLPACFPRDHRLPQIYRLTSGEQGDAKAHGPLAREPALAALEAAFFIADEPLTARRLAGIAGLKDGSEARRLIRKLQSFYEADQTAFQIVEIAGGFQLLTRPVFEPWLARLRPLGAELRLSPAARETLAIIAYRQPIMRADIESIRGVQCGEILRQLMEKNLIRIAGRHDSLGRPVLYGTTKRFLQVFGLKSLKDLPTIDDLPPPQGS
ncbi:MAG: hypothetical protein KatS3mg105_4400 [Gemmatales bacterium]|nr:MAG: hypothetical protein KatS3mg105_4400 [Gemmatales bacterium]